MLWKSLFRCSWFAAVLVAAQGANAALFIPDLPAGSTYHLAFLTDSVRHAIDEFNEPYDEFVMTDAAKNPDLEGIEFKSLSTTIWEDAATRLNIGGPVYRLDGVRIAQRASDLWDGSIEAPLNTTATGVKNKSVPVWTGSSRSGKNATCIAFGVNRECYLGSPDPNSQLMAGLSSATNSDWVTGDERRWTEQNAMYAVSVRLTVPQISLPGDMNGNGVVDAADIDLLGTAVRTGLTETKYDLDKNGAVNNNDVNFMVNNVLKTWMGDSNLDGQFNSADFVSVFVVGEYEDATPFNSTWAEGDWNLDRDFNTSDLVHAFTFGGFEQGPRSAVSAVPEPAAGTLLLLGVLGLLGGRRRTGSH